MPYIFHNHDTKVDFSISSSKYSSSNLKSYNNYMVKISQHLAPYTWVKFNYSYTPSYYIKSYLQSDPYISYSMGGDDYMPSMFTSEKTSIAAPPINDLFNASANAPSSIIPPRAQFISFAVLFILFSTFMLTKFSVSGVRGKCKVT